MNKNLLQWMFAVILSFWGVTSYAQDVEMTYPQAEWSKAGDILMHRLTTPHPAASMPSASMPLPMARSTASTEPLPRPALTALSSKMENSKS